MTGAVAAMCSALGFVPTSGAVWTDANVSPAADAVTFNSDGTVTSTVTGALANWGTPTTPSIGAGYWVKFVRTSGNLATNGTEGTWQQLNAAKSIGYTAGGLKSGTWDVHLATDSGGTGDTVIGTAHAESS